MNTSDPESGVETPAAPPDPWTKVERLYLCRHCGRAVGRARLTFSGGLHCDSCDEVCDQPIAVMYATAVEHTAATERQHHASREGALIRRIDAYDLDLTAARAEIAERDFRIRSIESEFGSTGHCCHQCAGALKATTDGDLRCTECDQQENELRAKIARLTKMLEGFHLTMEKRDREVEYE